MSAGSSAAIAASLRAAYLRASLAGIIVVTLAGAVVGIVLGMVSGYPGIAVVWGFVAAAMGFVAGVLLVGGVSVVVALLGGLAARTPRFRRIGLPAITGILAAVLTFAVLVVTPQVALWPVPLVALVMTGLTLGVVVWAERRAVRHPEPSTSAPTPSTPVQLLAIVVGGAAALVFATATVGLLRDRLHVLCSYGPPGTEAAGWFCPDGISYVMPGLGALVLSGCAVIVGLLSVWLGRGSPRVRPVLVGLAVVTALSGPVSTWVLAAGGPPSVVNGVRAGAWVAVVGPAALVVLLAVVVALVGLAVAGRALGTIGAALLVVASVVEVGLAVAFLPAAGLLVAATLGAPRVGGREAPLS